MEKQEKKVGNRYDFNAQQEKIIYEHANGKRIRKKEQEKLNDAFKFEGYSAWKKYILNKYVGYDKAFMVDFSRFLGQRIRAKKPSQEYWNIIMPILLTIVFTSVFEMLVETPKIDVSEVPLWMLILVAVVTGVAVAICLGLIIWKTMEFIWDNNEQENFYVDYKEIIDEIIEMKKKEQS